MYYRDLETNERAKIQHNKNQASAASDRMKRIAAKRKNAKLA